MDDDEPKPGWFTPGRLLVIFCVINLVVYLDRGVIASNGVNGSPRSEQLPEGSGIQGEFNLSNVQDGFLATAFLVGLLIASPIFSEACKHYSAFRLIGIGMGTWTLAAVGCGASPNYWVLIACRMLVGVGEASFVALAAPFIDDYAPGRAKARWFAAFYLCIPVGFAAGYIYGGLVGASLGWRAAFLIEGAVMVPFVVFAFISQPLHLTGSRDHGPDPTAPKSLKDVASELAHDAGKVASHTAWRYMCGAYILYTAVLGVYAFWGPKAGKRIFNLEGETADLVFGGVTVITGVFGSLIGGLMLDWLGSTLANANLICGLGQLVGLVLVLPAFLAAKNFTVFVVLFALGELGLFTLQAPVAAIGMWCVPTALRPLAISMVTVSIHLLGDVPSPPLVGALQSALESGKSGAEADAQWRITMSVASLLLFFSGCVFLRGSQLSKSAADYRKADELEEVTATAEHHHLHLPHHHTDQDGQHGAHASPAAAADAAEAGALGGGGRLQQGPASGAATNWAAPAISPTTERQPLLPSGRRPSVDGDS